MPRQRRSSREILSDRYDPNCRPAARAARALAPAGLLQQDDGPRTSSRKVEEVKALLTEADGYYQLRPATILRLRDTTRSSISIPTTSRRGEVRKNQQRRNIITRRGSL